jgi:hypothetical protein
MSGAGAQQDGEFVRGLRGELAGNLAGPAENGFADHGSRDHPVVEHDGEGPADVFLRHGGEAASALHVEAERHDRLVGALIEGGLAVDEIVARHHHAPLDEVACALLLAVEEFGVRRRAAGGGLLDRDRLIDEAEGHARGLAEKPLQLLGVLQARHLHENAVAALARDRGFGGAELVDAAAHDLDRLVDRGAHALVEARLGQRQAQEAGLGLGDLGFADGRAEREGGAQRLFHLAQALARDRHLALLANAQHHRVALDGEAGVADARLLVHQAAHVVALVLQPLAAHELAIDREQDVRAALEIEAERVARNLDGERVGPGPGHEIQDGEYDPEAAQHHDESRVPLREPQHLARRLRSLVTGSGRVGRFALGADLGHRRLHDSGAHALGDLDGDLVLVADLGDLADQAAGGDDRVAAA